MLLGRAGMYHRNMFKRSQYSPMSEFDPSGHSLLPMMFSRAVVAGWFSGAMFPNDQVLEP
jgi:hypothetical protein